MRFFSPVLILIGTSIVAAAVMASVVYYYQRERSFIEDKYTARSAEEIDDTYHASYFKDGEIDETIITEDNYYSDNLVADSEANKNNLEVLKYEKTVWDKDSNEWRKSTTVMAGNQVRFRIEIHLDNRSGYRKTLRIVDIMSEILGPVDNSATQTIDGEDSRAIGIGWIRGHGAPDLLPYSIAWREWLDNGHKITVPSHTEQVVDIYFLGDLDPPLPGRPCDANNTAYLLMPGYGIKEQQAFIGIEKCIWPKRTSTSLWRPDPGSTPGWAFPDNPKMAKYVRNISREETNWAYSTLASPGEQVEFLLHFELSGADLQYPEEIVISDNLGAGLDYNRGSSQLHLKYPTAEPLPDDWFNGYTFFIEEGPTSTTNLNITFTSTIESGVWDWDETGNSFTKNYGYLLIPRLSDDPAEIDCWVIIEDK